MEKSTKLQPPDNLPSLNKEINTMLTQIMKRTELVFWDAWINLLTRSNMARSLVKNTYQMIRDGDLSRYGLMVWGSAVVGLVSGYLLFCLTSVLR
jgi:hypothetical protein